MDVKAEELEAIRGMIDNQIDDIDCRWREALAVEEATKKAHSEALAAAKAEAAPPGATGHAALRRLRRARSVQQGGGHQIAETQGRAKGEAEGKVKPRPFRWPPSQFPSKPPVPPPDSPQPK
jgi:hypothetical protein